MVTQSPQSTVKDLDARINELIALTAGISKIGFTINGGASPAIVDGHGGTATVVRNSIGNYTITVPTAIPNMRPHVSGYSSSGDATTAITIKVEVLSTTTFVIDVENLGGANIDFNAYVDVF